MNNKPCIVGVADAKLLEKGKVSHNSTVLSIQRNCANEALIQAGLSINDVDGLAVAGLWGMPGPGIMQPNLLTEYLGLKYPSWLDGTNTGGSAFILHVNHAYQAILSGQCETVIILYGSMQKSQQEITFGLRPAMYSNQFDVMAGLPLPVGAYAMAANRHMFKYGTTKEDLAEVAVATRSWASLNPNATYRDKLTIDEVLSSRPIATPLNKLDCCLVTDGGGAIVMTTEKKAKELKREPVYILGYGESSSHASINYMPNMAYLEVAEHSSKKAYKMSNKKPSDIDLAMIYDSFTITVLMTLEALGICKPGEGKDFVKNQRTAPGGDFALNTNGGGLSYCHPGMYSIFTIIEACRQLWGICGDRQVENIKNAICHGTGGVLSSAATVILSKEPE